MNNTGYSLFHEFIRIAYFVYNLYTFYAFYYKFCKNSYYLSNNEIKTPVSVTFHRELDRLLQLFINHFDIFVCQK